jgi:hypothetical protein
MTKEEKLFEAQRTFVKLVVCLQASLELFDDLEGTNFYRHDIKRSVNATKRIIEKSIDGTHRHINTHEKEETYISIERAVHEIIESSVEDLFCKGYKPLLR